MLNDEMRANRDWWNEAAQVHYRGEGYEMKAFREGKIKLYPLELEEVGAVAGKRLLHLQCHFGMDTLSWARLGAQVTGVDYAEQAIDIARGLSQETGLDASFICSNIYDLPGALDAAGAFDIVFVSYGAINWLPDLQPWGKIIAHYLKPGGFFYIAEGHPFLFTMADKTPELKLGYPYFSKEAIKDDEQGTYAEREARLEHTITYGWNHTLSEIFDSLLSAGLSIDFFHEHQFCTWEALPEMEEGKDRLVRFKDARKREMLPLMFSLKATKR